MPLKLSRRPGHPGLWITGTITPAGAPRGVRIRRRAGSDDPRIAREEVSALEREVIRTAHLGERPASRGWGEAVAAYIQHDTRSDGTLALLARLTQHFADTPLDQINQAAVDGAKAALCRPGAKPGTILRNVIVPIRAVLHHAAANGWTAEPRIKGPRQTPGRTPCPLPADVEALRAAIAQQHQPLVTWLIGTGCRLGETQALQWADVDLIGARALLHAETTKASRSRVVHLVPAVVAALANLKHRTGPVFGETSIRTAWATACRKAAVNLRGAHDLRHAWASWHYALHRDLLALRTAGGWASVGQVERYAHLMPAGMENEIRRVWGLALEGQQRAGGSKKPSKSNTLRRVA